MELRYLRDREGREVDFVVLQDRRPQFDVECKLKDIGAQRSCHYFRQRTEIPEFYQVHLGKKDFGNPETDTRVLPFEKFCEIKNLV